MVFSSVLKYEFDPLESTETKFTSPHTAVSLVEDGPGYFDYNCSPTSISFGTGLLFTCEGEGLYFYHSNSVDDVRTQENSDQPISVGISDSTFVILDGFAYFEGNINGANQGLWRTDGSNVGTSLVKQISSINHLTAINGSLYFAGQSSAGIEPWISDGTNAGTKMVGDLVPGPGSSNPREFVEFDGKVFMTAKNETGERHIYWNGWTSGVINETRPISDTPSLGQHASIGAASGDNIIVASRGITNGNMELALNTGTSGFGPMTMSGANNMRDADIVVGSDGMMHISYVNAGSGDLVYFSTTEWPNANNLVHVNLEAVQNTYHSSIDVDSYNNPFVVYMDDAGNKIRLKYRLESTWYEALVDGNPSFRPTIQIDDYNNVHINYVSSNGTLMHALSTERMNNFSSWSISEIAGPSSSLGAFTGPSMSINDVNRVGMAATSVSDEEVRFFRNKIVNTDTNNSVIAMGSEHSCVLTDDSSVVCWGSQTEAFGVNISSSTSTPKVINDLEGKNTVQITSMDRGSCALSSDGDVRCWGNKSGGLLGFGSSTGSTNSGVGVQLIDLGTNVSIEQIDSAAWTSCAITDEGSVLCWGSNSNGQLGIGDNSGSKLKIGDAVNEMGDYLNYVDLGTNRTAKQVSVGGYHTCAILDNDLVKCWGSNSHGQLGIYTNGSHIGDNEGEMGDSLSYVDLGTGRTAKQISSGTYHTCAILDNDLVKCWGRNNEGQLGTGGGQSTYTPSSVNLGTGQTANSIDSGSRHVCVLLNNAEVRCWGRNNEGQLGTGSSSNSANTPQDVEAYGYPNTRDVVAIKSGLLHTCAVLEDFSLSCWGQNDKGQLGVAGVSQSAYPLTPAMLGWEVIGTTFVNHEDIPGTHNAGKHNSIAVDGEGVIHIAHGDIAANGNLRYTKMNPDAGWSSEIVDSTSTTGRYTSTYAEENGEVHISYFDHGAEDLKYAHHDGNGWTISTVDSGGVVGLFTSLVVDSDGIVHISYTDYSNMDLKYARYDGNWSINTVDSGGSVGQYTSIDVDANNNAVISYHDGSNLDLKLAVCNTSSSVPPTVSCSTSTVSSTGTVGTADTDVKIDEFGTIHILYQDSTDASNISLEYAYGSVGNFSSMSIDSGILGYTSLDIDDDGNVYVVYFDKENDDLRYAFSHISSNPPTWVTKIIDDGDLIYNYDLQNYPSGHSSMVVDEDGTLHISYLDLTHTKLKYGSVTNIDTHSDELTAITGDQDDFIAIYNDDITSEVYSLRLTEDGIVEHPVLIGQGEITTHSITKTKSSGDIYVSMSSDTDGLEIYSSFTEVDDWFLFYYDIVEYGDWSSISTLNDEIFFTYYDTYAENLLFSTDDGNGYANSISSEVIDSGGDVGMATSMTVDSQGKIHITYIDWTNGELKYAHGESQNWSVSTVTAPSEVWSVGVEGSALVLDSNDQPHICYFRYQNGTSGEVSYAQFDGTNWTIYDVPGQNAYCQLAIDSDDIVHMTYTSLSSFDTRYATKLPTSNIDSWNTTSIGSFFTYKPDLLIDKDDNLYLVYQDYLSGNLDYRYKLSDSAAWSGVNLVYQAPVGDEIFHLAAVVDSNNDLHICFVDDYDFNLVYLTNSNPGNSAFTSQIVENDLSHSAIDITVDNNDDIHISFMKSFNLYHTTLQGSGKGINGGDFNLYNTGITMPETLNVTGPGAGHLTVMGNNLYFVGSFSAPNLPWATGLELNKIGPDSSFVSLVKDITMQNGVGSEPRDLTVIGDTLYFSAHDGSVRELWKTDGTNAGTVMVKNIGVGSSMVQSIIAVEDNLFFRARESGNYGYELWTSDGTDSGTYQVKDINPGGPNGLSNQLADNHAVVGNALYFIANDGVNGHELWVTQGNETNTYMVADINAGSGDSFIDSMVAVGETVYFKANDGVNGNQLWKTISSQQISPPDIEIPFIGFDYQNHLFEFEFSVQNIDPANGPWEIEWYFNSGEIGGGNYIPIYSGTISDFSQDTLSLSPNSITDSAALICVNVYLKSGNGTTADFDENCFEPPLIMSDSNYEINSFNQEGIHDPLSCSDISNINTASGQNICDQKNWTTWVSAGVAQIPTDDLVLALNYSENVYADGFGIYIKETGYLSYLDKGALWAYDEVTQDWFEVGIFDIPSIGDDEEAQWVTFTGFSVNASSFLIDVDRNVGDYGHTVVWEIVLFEHPEEETYVPDIEMNFDSENDVVVEVNVSGMDPENAYQFDLHVHYPGIPYSSNSFGEVFHYQENLTLGINEKQFEFTINRSDFIENVIFCIDANLFYVSNQTHLAGDGNCFDLSNHAVPHIQHIGNGFDKVSEVSFYEAVLNNADQLTNGMIVEMLVSSNGTIYGSDSALNLDGDIDYEVNLSHQVGDVLPNGEVFSYYEDYCHVIIVYDGDQVLQNLVDIEYMCHYIDNDAEIHVLLDMENQTDSWFGFEIKNMSRDYEYDVHGTFTEDSNEMSNFSYAPIPNAGAGSTHTNWVSQFSPQPGKEYCVEAVLSEKWIHDPFAPWMNSRSANYCITFDGNQTNENNTGNQSTPGPEIFANLTLNKSATSSEFVLYGNYSVSNDSIGETYFLYYELFHAIDNTCSGFQFFGNYSSVIISDEVTITVDESMTMSETRIFDKFLSHQADYSGMDFSIIDSYYCLRLELVSDDINETIIDTDIDAIAFEATLDEPNPELFVEFYEDEHLCGVEWSVRGYCDEGVMVYGQRIDIQLDGAWYGYNHSISLKLANENGIIIYSYLSANDDYYQNGGWHPVYTNDYDDLSMDLMAPITNINAFTEDNSGPIYWKGDTNFLTHAGEGGEVGIWEYPSFEAGEYCLEISIGYQKDLNDSSFTSFRNLFDKQTYCGIFEHDSGEGIHWDSIDEDETCDDLTDASCVELLCENWEEQNPMLVDPRLENNGCPYELEIPEWWEEIPIVGDQINNIVETVQTEFGRYIGAVVFAVTVLGYAYRALTARSNFKKAKRMKKYERKIDKSNSKKDLDKVDADVEKAEDKNLLPTGGYGDLKEMIETRMEELFGDGSSGGDEANESMSRSFGYEDANDMFNEMQSGMEAMRETQQEMARMAESMRESQDSLFRQNLAPRAGAQRGGPKRPSQRPVSQAESLGKASGGPSRPSYHPKDLDEDGVVSEEDLQNWEKLSEAEKRARLTGSVRGGGSLTSEIVAFSKIPGSSKARCYCGSGKAYGKCHMSKEMCPCGSGKRFLKCCAKKRGFR